MKVIRRFVTLLLGMSGVLAVFAGTANAIGVVPANHCEPFADSTRTSESRADQAST
jgi:hypothetical protein